MTPIMGIFQCTKPPQIKILFSRIIFKIYYLYVFYCFFFFFFPVIMQIEDKMKAK